MALSACTSTSTSEDAECGRVVLGSSSGNRSMIMAFAGRGCTGPNPRVSLSVIAPVEGRCEAGHFTGGGTDEAGAPVRLDFEFASRSEQCNHGKGILRLSRGDRQVVARDATFGTLD